jgi:hypothetical protein
MMILLSGKRKTNTKNKKEGNVLGVPTVLGISQGVLPETVRSPSASFETVAAVADAGHLLVPAPPDRPSQDQEGTARRRKEQTSQQMACFWDREWTQVGGYDSICFVVRLFGRRVDSSEGDAGQKCQGQHAASVIWRYQPTKLRTGVLIEAKIFAIVTSLRRVGTRRGTIGNGPVPCAPLQTRTCAFQRIRLSSKRGVNAPSVMRIRASS